MCVDVPGVSIFDTSGPNPMITQITVNVATQRCMMWSYSQYTLLLMPTVSSAIAAMPPCPCSGFQAMFTPGYAWLPNSDCFVTTTQLYSNGQGGYMGQVCVKMCSYCVLTEHGTVVCLALCCIVCLDTLNKCVLRYVLYSVATVCIYTNRHNHINIFLTIAYVCCKVS